MLLLLLLIWLTVAAAAATEAEVEEEEEGEPEAAARTASKMAPQTASYLAVSGRKPRQEEARESLQV